MGNVPNGDPNVAQAFPFRYIPDAGDGAGIAQALAEVAVAGQYGDVYLRPGVYDFGLPNSPALPLVVPPSTSLRGPGVGPPLAVGGQPEAGVLLRASPSQRSMLVLSATASIRQLSFEVTTPDPGAVGSVFIDGGINGNPAFIDQVAVFVTADPAQAANESLTNIIRGDFLTITDGIISTFGNVYRTGTLVGIDAVDTFLSNVQAEGLDVGIRTVGGAFVNVTVGNMLVGVDFLAGGGGIRVSDLLCSAEQIGIRFASTLDGPALVDNVVLFGFTQAGPAPVGIQILAQSGGAVQLVNARISGFQTGISANAADTQISNSRVDVEQVGIELIDAGDSMVTGCNVTSFGVGTIGIDVRAASDGVMLGNNRVRGFTTGVQVSSSFTTLVSNNLRSNATPFVDAGSSNEIAHNQL